MQSITVICHDLTSNALSRAYILAKVLECDYRVHVVGLLKGEIWEPVRHDQTVEYRPFFARTAAALWWQGTAVAKRHIDGNLILAVKPLQASFGLGLKARKLRGQPLVLDMDDWELGFISDSIYWETRLLGTRWITSPNSPLYTRLLDRRIREADGLTVSSTFLQKRYGGLWIGQMRNERQFDPGLFSTGGGDAPTVLFLGSVREHKGVKVLLEAWRKVSTPGARLRIVGTPLHEPILQQLKPLADSRVSFEGPVPFAQVPEIIAQSDVFVLPQLDGRGSIGQVPMKMVDAMALGRAIIGTDVGDIPLWLANDSGMVVPAQSADSLAKAIDDVLTDPGHRARLGTNARQRFLQFGSFTSVRNRLLPWIADIIAGKNPTQPDQAFADCYRCDIKNTCSPSELCEEAAA